MSSDRKYSIKTYGHEVLKKIAEPVSEINAEIIQLGSDMADMMDRYDGIGLAAPQIGISKRIVVLGVPDSPESRTGTPGEELLLPQMPVVLINPEIAAYGGESFAYDEGCLSVPDIFGPVIRPANVILRSKLLDGSTIECECGGLLARCIQHELDHLDGKLFIDRLTPEVARAVRGDVDRLTRIGQSRNFRRNK